ncbi:MAG: hypothetical protein H6Q72_958 [Firmicutes bacterium]|nr:hypothetical protein [Bacillota bacterium]
MATLNETMWSWKDYASQQDPDGMAARVIDIMSEENAIVEDMYVMPGNKDYGLLTSQNATEPTVSIRGVNGTVTGTKGAFKQLEAHCALFTALGQIDKELYNAATDKNGFRANANKPFFNAMPKRIANELFYGSKANDAQSFDGLSQFYKSTTTDEFGEYVALAGGTGTDNRSIWLIDWGEDSCCGTYPKNTVAGLQHTPYPETLVDMPDGSKWPALQDLWEWRVGVAVRDYRKVYRIANISKAALKSINTTNDTAPNLFDLMIDALTWVNPSPRARFYGDRNIMSAFTKQAFNKSNNLVSMEEIYGKKRVPSFMGVPIRRCDALDTDESLVS